MLFVGHCSGATDQNERPSFHRSELADALLQDERRGSPTSASRPRAVAMLGASVSRAAAADGQLVIAPNSISNAARRRSSTGTMERHKSDPAGAGERPVLRSSIPRIATKHAALRYDEG